MIKMGVKSIKALFDKSKITHSVPRPYSPSIHFHDVVGGNLIRTLKVPLVAGACLGLVPIQGLWRNQSSFRWLHYRSILSALIVLALTCHTGCITYDFLAKILAGRMSGRDLILTISGVWFYTVGTVIYIFLLLKAKKLCQFFHLWKETSVKISHCIMPDKQLRKNVVIITTLVLLDCFGENMLFHLHSMTVEGRDKIASLTIAEFLRDYFNSNQYLSTFFHYRPEISLVMLITNKLATVAWNFGDLILILVARALHERYWALNEYIRHQMESRPFHQQTMRTSATSWTAIRTSFLQITRLVQEANKHFSPLIWLSCGTDVFFICRQLYEALAPRPLQESLLNKVYLGWSLLHLIGRTLGVNMMATAMNEEAHRTFKVIQQCHPREYNEEVRRMEIFLGGRIIGLSASGCFIITRTFVTTIISAIFTLEVVLLQNAHLTVG